MQQIANLSSVMSWRVGSTPTPSANLEDEAGRRTAAASKAC